MRVAGQTSRIIAGLGGIGALLLLLGCTEGIPLGGTGGVGGTGGLGGRGGAAGTGGVGGVDLKLGWCGLESIDLGETERPVEISMAADALGNVVVVWREYRGTLELWTNRWTPQDGWGTAERLQVEAGPTLRARVVMDTNGNAIAVWRQSDCVGSYRIWSRRWTPNAGWGEAERIDIEDGAAPYPELAVDSHGNVVAVWTQATGIGVRSTWANRWTEGSGWGTAERIHSSDSYARDPLVAIDGEGNTIATWREYTNEAVHRLWLNRWTPQDGWGTPEHVDAAQSVGKYDMAVGAGGDVLAVWSSGRGVDSDFGLWSARWTGTWEPPERLADDRRTFDPKVAFDANGTAVAAWMYWTGPGTEAPRIWAARWSAANGWDEIAQLHGATSEYEPRVATDRHGNAIVGWHELGFTADGPRSHAWTRRWTPDEGWVDAERIDDAVRSAGPPEVVFDGLGVAVAVWSESGTLRSRRYERGCSLDGGGGQGGSGGGGGAGGVGGSEGTDLCAGVVCSDSECRSGGGCDPDDGTCSYATTVEDGTVCSEGVCLEGGCGRSGAWACTEQGLRDAIAAGGGPHFFACDETTPIVLDEAVVIGNDVILDGEGELVLERKWPASQSMIIEPEANAELRSFRSEGIDYSIYSQGALTVTDSTLAGIYNTDGTLTLIDTEVRGLGVYNAVGSAMLIRCRVLGSEIRYVEEGIHNVGGSVTVRDSVISGWGMGEWPGRYGAVENIGHDDSFVAELILENTTIAGNRGQYAGAIYNSGGIVTLKSSTVSNNIAERGPSIYTSHGYGNARHIGALTLINTTVSGAAVEYECGSRFNGYAIGNSGELTVTNSTLAGNAFGALDNRGDATVTNSVLDGGCVQIGDDSVLVSGGHNIVGGSDTCGFDDPNDMVNVSSSAMALGPLADNGGPTMTHALLPGSVAIDGIPEPMCEVAVDQRGEPRPAGGMCDIGAFELQP